mgnify:CR=1 FL=1
MLIGPLDGPVLLCFLWIGLWIGLGDWLVYAGSWRFRAGFLTQRVKASGQACRGKSFRGRQAGFLMKPA